MAKYTKAVRSRYSSGLSDSIIETVLFNPNAEQPAAGGKSNVEKVAFPPRNSSSIAIFHGHCSKKFTVRPSPDELWSVVPVSQ